MLDTAVLSIATVLVAVGVGGLIAGEVRAARAARRRMTSDLGWTLLWAAGLSALFVAAWVARR